MEVYHNDFNPKLGQREEEFFTVEEKVTGTNVSHSADNLVSFSYLGRNGASLAICILTLLGRQISVLVLDVSNEIS